MSIPFSHFFPFHRQNNYSLFSPGKPCLFPSSITSHRLVSQSKILSPLDSTHYLWPQLAFHKNTRAILHLSEVCGIYVALTSTEQKFCSFMYPSPLAYTWHKSGVHYIFVQCVIKKLICIVGYHLCIFSIFSSELYALYSKNQVLYFPFYHS